MNIATHNAMLRLTADMPMRQINRGTEPYLQRYFAREFSPKYDLWFHRFLSADGDEAVHSHPFEFRSSVLCGRQVERVCQPNHNDWFYEHRPEIDYQEVLEYLHCTPSGLQAVGRPTDLYAWHQITEVQPNTWTMLFVDKRRVPFWAFRRQTHDETCYSVESGAPRDWYKQYKPRGHNPGDVL